MRTDPALLDEWRQGDDQAGEELVKRHMRTLYGFFRSKVDGEIDELMQRTWLACVESRDAFRGDSTFRTYLLGIARHQLLAHFRRVRRDLSNEDIGSRSVADLGTSASGRLARKHEHALLLQALRQLPLDQQIALELYYWEDLSGKELGAVLGVPTNTARTQLYRARQALAAKVERLARSSDLLDETTGGLARWVTSLRDYLNAEGRTLPES